MMRVLAPGGVLWVSREGQWKKTVKPVPEGTDEWNQFLHGADNNGVSLDDVGPPQRLRWHAGPEYGRSKAISPSFSNMVTADGVVFTIEDRATTEDVNAPSQYYLVARDAYNGIELWKRPMPKEWIGWQGGSIKSISTQQQRCLAAIGKTVYVCTGFGGPVTALDSRTGAEKQVYEATEQTAEFLIEGNILYGIKGAPYRVGKSNVAGSVELYALDLDKGAMIWSKHIANEYTGGTLVVKGRRLVLPQQGWVDLPGRCHRRSRCGRRPSRRMARRSRGGGRPQQGGSKGQERPGPIRLLFLPATISPRSC